MENDGGVISDLRIISTRCFVCTFQWGFPKVPTTGHHVAEMLVTRKKGGRPGVALGLWRKVNRATHGDRETASTHTSPSGTASMLGWKGCLVKRRCNAHYWWQDWVVELANNQQLWRNSSFTGTHWRSHLESTVLLTQSCWQDPALLPLQRWVCDSWDSLLINTKGRSRCSMAQS